VASIERDNLTLRGKIAGLEADASTQRERAARAEKSLLEVKQDIAPRTLSAEQRASFVKMLRTGPRGEVSITCLTGKEPCDFAQHLAMALREAGWSVTGPTSMLFIRENSGPPVGLIISVPNAAVANQSSRAGMLQDALHAIGLEAPGNVNPNLKDGEVNLFVGVKPPRQ
jgi:hypothetical protein